MRRPCGDISGLGRWCGSASGFLRRHATSTATASSVASSSACNRRTKTVAIRDFRLRLPQAIVRLNRTRSHVTTSTMICAVSPHRIAPHCTVASPQVYYLRLPRRSNGNISSRSRCVFLPCASCRVSMYSFAHLCTKLINSMKFRFVQFSKSKSAGIV